MNEEPQLLDEIMGAMNPELKKIALENSFPYIFSKAYRYLKVGPEEYRKHDPFQQPPTDLDAEELEVIKLGCQQILNGKGLTAENPLMGIHIRGFKLLFDLFHFDFKSQYLLSNHSFDEDSMLDQMNMIHPDDGSTVTYFNLVSY